MTLFNPYSLKEIVLPLELCLKTHSWCVICLPLPQIIFQSVSPVSVAWHSSFKSYRSKKIKGNVFSVLNKIRNFFSFKRQGMIFMKTNHVCNNKFNIQVYINTWLKTKWQIHILIKLRACTSVLLINITTLATL